MNSTLRKTLNASKKPIEAIKDYDYLGAVGLQKKPKHRALKIAASLGLLAIGGFLAAKNYNSLQATAKQGAKAVATKAAARKAPTSKPA